MKRNLWQFLGTVQFRNIILAMFAIAALWFVYEFRHQYFGGGGFSGQLSGVESQPIVVKMKNY